MAELNDKQIKTLRKLIETAEANLAGAKELLASLLGDTGLEDAAHTGEVAAGKVIEGEFDGQNMTGPDGKVYPVPPPLS